MSARARDPRPRLAGPWRRLAGALGAAAAMATVVAAGAQSAPAAPLFEHAKLLSGEETGGEWFGYSVATSADASTLLVGAPHARGEAGEAWVYVRAGRTWVAQAGLTVGSEGVAGSRAGTSSEEETEDEHAHAGASVALSADGNTALVGRPGAEAGVGSVTVFTRSGTSWSAEAELTPGGEARGEGRFGRSVALSHDGTTALV